MTQDLPITPLIPGEFIPDLQPSPVKELADFMRSRQDLAFNMSYGCKPKPDCGTPGCIGGFGLALWGSEIKSYSYEMSIIPFDGNKLARKLEISFDLMHSLCFDPRVEGGRSLLYSQVNRSMAIAALDRLDKTGTVYFEEDQDEKR